MDHKGRLSRLRQILNRQKLDSLLITHLPNIRYLCGFTGSSGALLVADSGAVFFTDGRYVLQARAEVAAAKVVIARAAPLAALGKHLASSLGAGRPWTRTEWNTARADGNEGDDR